MASPYSIGTPGMDPGLNVLTTLSTALQGVAGKRREPFFMSSASDL